MMGDQGITNDILGAKRSAELLQVRNILFNNPDSRSALLGRKILLGILADADTTNLIISTQFWDASDADKVINSLSEEKILGMPVKELYTFRINDSLHYYAAFKEDLLMISPSAHILTERLALDPAKKNKFHTYVDQRQQISKNKLLTGYIDFNTLKRAGLTFLSGKMDGELAFLNNLDAFAEVNYNFSKTKLQLYGTTVVNGMQNYYRLFSELSPVPITINNVLPANTSSYKIFGIDDINKFKDLLAAHFKRAGLERSAKDLFNNIRQRYLIDLQNTVYSNFKNEMMTFQLA
ncbi:MAG: hypothetical protein EOP49_43060, partial [Sphingobacteriales bacterium]